MGRPPKVKLDYAGWSVDIFDTDTKIDKLIDSQGWAGFGIYFYLCQRAYGSDGYYYKWSYADCSSTARKMGGGISGGTVKEVVNYCLQIGLFDKRLFDKWGILTSKGVQARYLEVAKRRVNKVISEFWLLQDSEGIIKEPLSDENEDFCNRNPGFCSIKETKEKENKEKEKKENKKSKEISCVVDAWNDLGIAQVAKVLPSSARESQLLARIKEHGLDGVLNAIEKVRQSAFLMGESENSWRCTFDWLIKASNMIKVIEGNYDDRPKQVRSSAPRSRKEEQLSDLLSQIRGEGG